MVDIRYDDLDDDEPPMLGETAAPTVFNILRGAEQAQDSSIMDEIMAVAQRAKEAKRRQDKDLNCAPFGQGLKKGFFNSTNSSQRKKATPAQHTTSVEPSRQQLADERLLIVKAQKKDKVTVDSSFVFPEVQNAIKSMKQIDPKEWMNERFFQKLAQNPNLAQALQNPSISKAIAEMQHDPHAAVLKYQNDRAVSIILRDFMEFLGNHFEEISSLVEPATFEKKTDPQQHQRSQPSPDYHLNSGQTASGTPKPPAIVDLDETRRRAIAKMERTPEEEQQVQRILKNPELLAALSDGNLIQRLHSCQRSRQHLQQLARDPVLGPKLRLLLQHNMVHFAESSQ